MFRKLRDTLRAARDTMESLKKIGPSLESMARNYKEAVPALISIAQSAKQHDSHHIEQHRNREAIKRLLELLQRVEREVVEGRKPICLRRRRPSDFR